MNELLIENPWNAFLDSQLISACDKNCKLVNQSRTGDKMKLICSVPKKFEQVKHILCCNKCDLLISLRSCLPHIKMHDKPLSNVIKKTELSFKSSEKNVNNHTNSMKKSRKTLKKESYSLSNHEIQEKELNQISDEHQYETNVAKKQKTVSNSSNNNNSSKSDFPKSILNKNDPLKLKIQFPPRSSSSNRQNGNIFDNLNNFYTDLKDKIIVPSYSDENESASSLPFNGISGNNRHHYRPTDYFDDFNDVLPSSTFDNNNVVDGSTEGDGCYSFRQVTSSACSDNILRIKKFDLSRDESGLQNLQRSNSSGSIGGMSSSGRFVPSTIHFPGVQKKIIPSSQPPSSQIVLQPRFISDVQQAQQLPPNVFLNLGAGSLINKSQQKCVRKVLPTNGLRKWVRIQHMNDNSSTVWQVSPADNVPMTDYPCSDATQKQFQQRLIQQGLFTENDVIRCSRTTTIPDTNPRRKITVINRTCQPNSFHSSGPVRQSNLTYPRFIDSKKFSDCHSNQKMYRQNVVIRGPKTLTISNHHLKSSFSAPDRYSSYNVELSDEEFLLDSQFVNSNSNQSHSSSPLSTAVSSSFSRHSDPHFCQTNYTISDTELMSTEADSLDSGIHILPSPSKKITELPWDI